MQIAKSNLLGTQINDPNVKNRELYQNHGKLNMDLTFPSSIELKEYNIFFTNPPPSLSLSLSLSSLSLSLSLSPVSVSVSLSLSVSLSVSLCLSLFFSYLSTCFPPTHFSLLSLPLSLSSSLSLFLSVSLSLSLTSLPPITST